MPAVKTPTYDRLPQGTGYQDIPVPKDDAAAVPDLSFKNQDSHNETLEMKPVSLATETDRATIGEWNTWNSGWREDSQIGHDDGAIGAK